MRFQEDFLQFIWQFQLFNGLNCTTTQNQPIEIIQVGILNKHAGPDFTNAKIRIGDTLWAGNVEIHLQSSAWDLHQHQNDPAYQNVILHVVLEDDQPVHYDHGSPIPTLVLKGRFAASLWDNYQNLVTSPNDFPCQSQIGNVDPFVIHSFLSRTLVERLELKSDAIFKKLQQLKYNWDETFYQFMAINFGFKVNALPMELLAQSLPQQVFAKHKDNSLQIEALVFGQAGFLGGKLETVYARKLKTEYVFLAKKYKLNPVDRSLWKFLRMRPQNFPTLRLAQFAALVVSSNHLFSKILECKEMSACQDLLAALPVNPFWETHYHFGNETKKVALQLGKKSVENILINTVALFLFAYGKQMDQPNFVTRALNLLESLPAEDNAVIKQYVSAGVEIKNAYQSQGILQLHKNYCNQKKCLNCGIGIKILKR